MTAIQLSNKHVILTWHLASFWHQYDHVLPAGLFLKADGSCILSTSGSEFFSKGSSQPVALLSSSEAHNQGYSHHHHYLKRKVSEILTDFVSIWLLDIGKVTLAGTVNRNAGTRDLKVLHIQYRSSTSVCEADLLVAEDFYKTLTTGVENK